MHVVAAIVIRDSTVFAARRAVGRASSGKWEFPGGKVELKESPVIALQREIEEELGVLIRVLKQFDRTTTSSGEAVIDLDTYLCEFLNEDPDSSSDHDEFNWISISELSKYDFAEPDRPAIRKLIEWDINHVG